MRLRLLLEADGRATLYGNTLPGEGTKLTSLGGNTDVRRYLEVTTGGTIVQWVLWSSTSNRPAILVGQKSYNFLGRLVAYTYMLKCGQPALR